MHDPVQMMLSEIETSNHEAFATAALFLCMTPSVLQVRTQGEKMSLQKNTPLKSSRENKGGQSELTDIRVPKHEPLIQLVLHPIHLAADDAEQRLTVDQHLHAVLLHRFVERARLVHILQVVRQT